MDREREDLHDEAAQARSPALPASEQQGEESTPAASSSEPTVQVSGRSAVEQRKTQTKGRPKSEATKKDKARKKVSATTTPEWAKGMKVALKMVPVTQLCVVDEDRVEEESGSLDFHDLKKSIEELGILQNLVVTFDKKLKKHRVIAGKRRLRAAKELRLPEVPTLVIESAIDEGTEHLIALIENANRKNQSPWEMATKFQKALDATDKPQAEIASMFGLTKSMVTDYLKLLEPEVKEKILSEEEFEQLKRGKYSAKKVCRAVDGLRRQNGPGQKTSRGEKRDPGPGDPKVKRVKILPDGLAEHCEVLTEYSDLENAPGIWLIVAVEPGNSPPLGNIIEVFERHIHTLRVMEQVRRGGNGAGPTPKQAGKQAAPSASGTTHSKSSPSSKDGDSPPQNNEPTT